MLRVLCVKIKDKTHECCSLRTVWDEKEKIKKKENSWIVFKGKEILTKMLVRSSCSKTDWHKSRIKFASKF